MAFLACNLPMKYTVYPAAVAIKTSSDIVTSVSSAAEEHPGQDVDDESDSESENMSVDDAETDADESSRGNADTYSGLHSGHHIAGLESESADSDSDDDAMYLAQFKRF